MDRTPIINSVLPGHASLVLPERPPPAKGHSLRKRALASAGAAIIGSFAPPALAASEPSTMLVRCGEDSCLQVSGRRSGASIVVRINGHVVPAEGERSWRIRLPIDAVRQWSVPYARTIEVSLHDPQTQRQTVSSVDLPIGLLGGVTELASLVVRVR